MDKRWAVVAVLFGLINGPAVQAQGMSGWVEPDQQRIAVLDEARVDEPDRAQELIDPRAWRLGRGAGVAE